MRTFYDGKTLDDDNEVYREDQNNFPYRYERKKFFQLNIIDSISISFEVF